MTKHYHTRFLSMVENLKQNPNIIVHQFTMGEPTTTQQIEAAKQNYGYLPDGVEDFYREMNGFVLEWEHTIEEIKQNDNSDRGYINLLPIEAIFGNWKDIVWFDTFEGGDEFINVKPFDFFINEGCAAFLMTSQPTEKQFVYFHELGQKLYCTQYYFKEYLEKLLASRGYWYWIETLCEALQKSVEVSAFRRKMPLIFEDYNNELFLPKNLLYQR